jgi:hypothetical protein
MAWRADSLYELALDQLLRCVRCWDTRATDSIRACILRAGTHPGGFMTGGSGRLAADNRVRWLNLHRFNPPPPPACLYWISPGR